MSILVIDAGTTTLRGIIFSEQGRLLKRREYQVPTIQDGVDWLQDARRVRKYVLEIEKWAAVAGVKKVGVTGQRSSFLIWEDSRGRPLTPVISWKGTGTPAEQKVLRSHRSLIRRISGLEPVGHYSAVKLGRIWREAGGPDRFWGTLNSYILFLLTGGEWITDYSNAQRSLLFNRTTRRFSGSLLEIFGLSDLPLPKLSASLLPAGVVSGKGMEIGCSIGDQQAAALGITSFEEGVAGFNAGTGGFLFCPSWTSPRRKKGMLIGVTGLVDPYPSYIVEGTINNVGGLLEQGGIIVPERQPLRFEDITTRGVPLFRKGESLGSPYWTTVKKGSISGKPGLGSVWAQVIYLALENFSRLAPAGILRRIRVGGKPFTGGPGEREVLADFITTLFGVPAQIDPETEPTAWGVYKLLSGNIGTVRSEGVEGKVIGEKLSLLMADYRKWRTATRNLLSRG